jgi:hypothetical protein
MVRDASSATKAHGSVVGRAALEAPVQSLAENTDSESTSPSRLHEFFSQIFSVDDEQIKQGIVQIQSILGAEDPPLADVVAIEGAVQRLLQLLEHPDEGTRLSAAMCVTKLSCGGSRKMEELFAFDGGIKYPRLLLAPGQPESIREQMAWTVANLAGSSRTARNILLEGNNAMGIVIDAITANPNNTLPTLRKLALAMANLCRHKPVPPLESVAPALPVCHLLMQHSDTEVQDSACWAVSYISDGPEERIRACQNAGLIPTVLELLRTQRPSVMMPAIRTVGNFAVSSAGATQAIVEMGVLQLMAPLMQPHVERLIRKECCWTLSNLAAGTHAQVQAVLDSGLMRLVLRCISDPELDVKKEAVWVVANVGAGGTPDQLRAAVEHFNCIPDLCTALRTRDAKMCSIALDATEAVLELGDTLRTRGVNPYAEHFEAYGIGEILLDLLESPVDTVSACADDLMRLYWGNLDA